MFLWLVSITLFKLVCKFVMIVSSADFLFTMYMYIYIYMHMYSKQCGGVIV